MLKLEIVFSKTGMMKYISHLDLMRLFQRAIGRAQLPVALTKGFTPHLRISIKRALKLGLESLEEHVTFSLEKFIAPNEFKEKLKMQLPSGITIKEIIEL